MHIFQNNDLMCVSKLRFFKTKFKKVDRHCCTVKQENTGNNAWFWHKLVIYSVDYIFFLHKMSRFTCIKLMWQNTFPFSDTSASISSLCCFSAQVGQGAVRKRSHVSCLTTSTSRTAFPQLKKESCFLHSSIALYSSCLQLHHQVSLFIKKPSKALLKRQQKKKLMPSQIHKLRFLLNK